MLIFVIDYGSPAGRPVEDNSVIQFYPTIASFDEKSALWEVPIHGHVYDPKEHSLFRNSIINTFRSELKILSPQDSEIFAKRMRLFMVDNRRWRRISIRLGDRIHVLKNTNASGHVKHLLRISESEMNTVRLRNGRDNPVTFHAILADQDKRKITGKIFFPPDNMMFLITDIDDTIKISDVRNKKSLMENTFMKPFRAVPDMTRFFSVHARAGVRIFYVSASPWQLYPELSAFVQRAGFPDGIFCLKYFRLKDSTAFSIFVSGFDYKIKSIEPIIKTFPKGRFILLGDSGEQDPEAYGHLAEKYPGRIEKILIRKPYGDDDPNRYQAAFKGVDRKIWQVFNDPREILMKSRYYH